MSVPGRGWPGKRDDHRDEAEGPDGIEFATVWGRDRTAAADAADTTPAYDEIDAFLAEVDGLAFAVPPGVQAPIAVHAARPGSTCCWKSPSLYSRPRRMP